MKTKVEVVSFEYKDFDVLFTICAGCNPGMRGLNFTHNTCDFHFWLQLFQYQLTKDIPYVSTTLL
jgi:hypothetical protein